METANLTFSQLLTAVKGLSSPEQKEILNFLESENLQLNDSQKSIVKERQEAYLSGKMDVHSLENIKEYFDSKD